MPTYVPSQTATAFHHDTESDIKILFGHVGSGKSTSCCAEIMHQFLKLPVCTDNVRRGRWAIVRNTYSELKMTTLKTWLMWFNEEQFGKLYKQAPFEHQMRFTDELGVRCELDVVFLAMDNDKTLRSSSLTSSRASISMR